MTNLVPVSLIDVEIQWKMSVTSDNMVHRLGTMNIPSTVHHNLSKKLFRYLSLEQSGKPVIQPTVQAFNPWIQIRCKEVIHKCILWPVAFIYNITLKITVNYLISEALKFKNQLFCWIWWIYIVIQYDFCYFSILPYSMCFILLCPASIKYPLKEMSNIFSVKCNCISSVNSDKYLLIAAQDQGLIQTKKPF